MEKLIEVTWSDSKDDTEFWDDAIVEYVRYDEDGRIVNEVLNVFLPENVPLYQHAEVKQQAISTFHDSL